MNNKFLEIISEIYNVKKDINQKEGVDVWFRGQADANWLLESTIHRYTREVFEKCKWEWDEENALKGLREQYKTLYRKFKAKAWNILPNEQKNEWAIIFSMRHYGIKTTLLDWTESLLFAIYFANYGRNPNVDSAIYVLNPVKLNENGIGEKHLVALEEQSQAQDKPNLKLYHPHYVKTQHRLPPIAVTPVLTNSRMIAQRATFVICGDSFESLEKQFPDCIKKFVLPADTYEDSQEYLNCNGVTHFGLFPDLYGLKEELDRELEEQIELIINKVLL